MTFLQDQTLVTAQFCKCVLDEDLLSVQCWMLCLCLFNSYKEVLFSKRISLVCHTIKLKQMTFFLLSFLKWFICREKGKKKKLDFLLGKLKAGEQVNSSSSVRFLTSYLPRYKELETRIHYTVVWLVPRVFITEWGSVCRQQGFYQNKSTLGHHPF